MWGINQGQISRIIGAEERTRKICAAHNSTQKLTPKHEQIIRRASKPLQDKIAQVTLTRESKPKSEDKKPHSKRLTVAQTNTLVNEVSKDPERAEEMLDHFINLPITPQEATNAHRHGTHGYVAQLFLICYHKNIPTKRG